MSMVFCRSCGGQVHESAQACPHCGGVQGAGAGNLGVGSNDKAVPWLSIVSLIIGIVCALSLFDESDWDTETVVGVGVFALTGLGLGIAGVNTQRTGRGLGIAGIVLSAVTIVICIGLMSD